MPLWMRLVAIAALMGGAVIGWNWHVQHERGIGREEGRNEIIAKWNQANMQHLAADAAQAKKNAEETERRVKAQQENDRAKERELAAARAAADRNARDAERLRRDNLTASEQWRARLADSPTRQDIEAAGAAIAVCTDLLGRLDRRAGELAAYADAARASGLKCERDYDALTKP